MRATLAIIAAAVLALPIGFVATIFLMPLWSWVERVYGIESVGHSGPADWCYGVTMLIVFLIFAVALVVGTRQPHPPKEGA